MTVTASRNGDAARGRNRVRRCKPETPPRPLDRQLEPREPHAVEHRGQGHRRPQSAVIDLARVPRVHRVAAVAGRRRLAPAAGFQLSAGGVSWRISIPSLVGATLRISSTSTVPRFGYRNWAIVSAGLLLVPSIGLAITVSNPATPCGVLLLVCRPRRLRRWQLRQLHGEHPVSSTRARRRAGRSGPTPPAASSAPRLRSSSCRSRSPSATRRR